MCPKLEMFRITKKATKVSWLKSLSFKLPFYNFLNALFILTFAITAMFSTNYQKTKLAFLLLWATFLKMNIIILTWLVPCNFVHNPSVRKLEPDSWWQTELNIVELIFCWLNYTIINTQFYSRHLYFACIWLKLIVYTLLHIINQIYFKNVYVFQKNFTLILWYLCSNGPLKSFTT